MTEALTRVVEVITTGQRIVEILDESDDVAEIVGHPERIVEIIHGVGAVNATEAEAIAGLLNTRYMSPLRVAQAIDYRRPRIHPCDYGFVEGTVDTGANLTALHAAMADAVALGTPLYTPRGEYGIYGSVKPPHGLVWECDPGVILYRDQPGVAFITQDDITESIRLTLTRVRVASRQTLADDAAGAAFSLNLRDSVLDNCEVVSWDGGAQGFSLYLYRSVIINPIARCDTTRVGTGGFRVSGGEDFVIIGGYSDCGDDSWQTVTAATPPADGVTSTYNLPIRRGAFLSPRGKSHLGRFAIIASEETVTSNIEDISFIDAHGKSNGDAGIRFSIESFNRFDLSSVSRDGSGVGTIVMPLNNRNQRIYQLGEVIELYNSSNVVFNKNVTLTAVGNQANSGGAAGSQVTFNAGASTIQISSNWSARGISAGQSIEVVEADASCLNDGLIYRIVSIVGQVATVTPAPISETVVCVVTNKVTLNYADVGSADSATGQPKARRVNPAKIIGCRYQGSIDIEGASTNKWALITWGPGYHNHFDVLVKNPYKQLAYLFNTQRDITLDLKCDEVATNPTSIAVLLRDVDHGRIKLDIKAPAAAHAVTFTNELAGSDNPDTDIDIDRRAINTEISGVIRDIRGGFFALNVNQGDHLRFKDLALFEKAGESTRAKGLRFNLNTSVLLSSLDFSGLVTTLASDQITKVAGAPAPVLTYDALIGAYFGSSLSAIKAADLVRSGTATLANDNELVLNLAPQSTYLIEGVLLWNQGAANLGGFQYALTLSSASGNDLDWTDPAAIGSARQASGGAVSSTAVNRRIARPGGIARVGNAPVSLALQWAQSVSDATGVTLYANSSLRAVLISGQPVDE